MNGRHLYAKDLIALSEEKRSESDAPMASMSKSVIKHHGKTRTAQTQATRDQFAAKVDAFRQEAAERNQEKHNELSCALEKMRKRRKTQEDEGGGPILIGRCRFSMLEQQALNRYYQDPKWSTESVRSLKIEALKPVGQVTGFFRQFLESMSICQS